MTPTMKSTTLSAPSPMMRPRSDDEPLVWPPGVAEGEAEADGLLVAVAVAVGAAGGPTVIWRKATSDGSAVAEPSPETT